MKKKIGLLFAPFLLIAICFAGLYSFLHWLLIIRLQLFPLKKDILEFWLPFILAWIPALLWLRPRIRLLNLKRKRGDLPFLYLIVAVIAIAAPTLVAQQYIVTATGKLTALQTPDQIAEQQATKYYTLQRHFADKAHSRVFKSFDVSGRNNEYFNMHIYIVLPLLAESKDTMAQVCSNWIGQEYDKQVSNRQTEEEKKYALNIFLRDTKTDFDYTDPDKFVYLDRIGKSDAHDGFDEAIKKSPWGGGGSNSIFTAVDAPFAARNGNKLAWIFGALGIGSVLWLIMILLPKFDGAALARWEHRQPAVGGSSAGAVPIGSPGEPGKGAPDTQSAGSEALSLFLPRKGYFITPIIVDLNLVIFLIMAFSGAALITLNAQELLDWGANYRPYTVDGQWWRLLTSVFLHAGIMHLLANMVGLIFVGVMLEPVLGRTKYAVCYLVTGIAASLASLYWHEGTVSIGASGAIFGLFGIFLALLLTNVFIKEVSKAFLVTTVFFIVYNFVAGMTGGVDSAAHIGGLVSGLILGFCLAPGLKKRVLAMGVSTTNAAASD